MKRSLFLLLFCAFGANANVGERLDDIIEQIVPKAEISNEQLRALRHELKIQRLFIEGVKGIELRGGDFADISKASNTIEELIISSFDAKSSSLPNHLRDSLKTTLQTSVNKGELRKAMVKLKEFISTNASAKKTMLASTARRFGFDVGLVYLLTLQLDFTFPSVMMAMGHMQFAPLLVTPISSMATGTYAAVKSAVRLNHLVKVMGGFSNARAHLEIFNQVKNFFHASIFPRFDIIDIGVAGKNFTLTVEKQNLLTRFKQRLGWSKTLNYKSLVAHLKSENIMGKFLEEVASSERPEQVKLLRILHRIELEDNPEIIVKLKEKFGSYIQEMNHLPEFNEGRKWAAKIARSKSFDDFARLMMSIPDDIPPAVFDKIWRNHILPQASKSVGPFIDKDTYKAFRDLENTWQTNLRKSMSESVELTLDDHWRKMLSDYFFKALPAVNGCSAIYNKRGDYAPLL